MKSKLLTAARKCHTREKSPNSIGTILARESMTPSRMSNVSCVSIDGGSQALWILLSLEADNNVSNTTAQADPMTISKQWHTYVKKKKQLSTTHVSINLVSNKLSTYPNFLTDLKAKDNSGVAKDNSGVHTIHEKSKFSK